MSADLLHGGALDAMQQQFPSAPKPWIDLSTGVNPWPYPVDNTHFDTIARLPQQAEMQSLRRAAANSFGINPDHLLAAPGSELLIRLLPLVTQAQRVAIARCCYGDYEDIWLTRGSHPAEVLKHDNPLQLADKVDLIIIGQPNNPDGREYSVDEVLDAHARLQQHNGSLVVDEAYAELNPAVSLMSRAGVPGLIVLRSFGKFYGLPGLRLGWLAAHKDTLIRFADILGAWPVNSPALCLATQAYDDTAWQTATRQRLHVAELELKNDLLEAGLEVTGGTSLFCLVKHNQAHSLWRSLAEAGIYVRRFADHPRLLRFGLPQNQYARQRLIAALLK